jgi:hypothetical protein
MIFSQHYLACLPHASYLIGDETTSRAVVRTGPDLAFYCGGGAVSCRSLGTSAGKNPLLARDLRTHCIGGCILKARRQGGFLREIPAWRPRNQ